MKIWIAIITLFPILSFGQQNDDDLEIAVIKETLPQVLNANPNSIVSMLRGGEMYELLSESFDFQIMIDSTADTSQMKKELDDLSDSIATILEENKIIVTLSDTLFAYTYTPRLIEYKDGSVDTMDERKTETWNYTKEDLVAVFQTDYEFRGLSNPVDLEFIDLVKMHINNKGLSDKRLVLNELNSSYYKFTNQLPENTDSLYQLGLLINGIRVYRPVFNDAKDKACYLYAGQVRNGPWREFIFVEKIDEQWVFIESYGSSHIDGNDNWF